MTVTAPYNFVPLSRYVCQAADLDPALAGLPSQDDPAGVGKSGSLSLTLTAETPILVGWDAGDGQIKKFGRVPDGAGGKVPAIPGSSLRGMVRNVLEIASFGKMALVDDARTAMRDLNAVTDYRRHCTFTRANRAFESRVLAGLLQVTNGKVMLTPCDYARVDHRDTLSGMSLFGGQTFRQRIEAAIAAHGNARTKIVWEGPGQTPRPTDTTIAEIVERIYLEATGTAPGCTLYVEDDAQDHPHNAKTLHYKKAAASIAALVGPSTTKSGTLVFTGMPSHHKHMEFFFFDPKTAEDVDPKVIRMFLDVQELQEKVSPTWRWRKAEYERGQPIPVFFLRDGTRVRQIGLSMMFKMAGDNSVHALLGNTSKDHVSGDSDAQIDLPTRIFGRITADKSGAKPFRTRVSFGWAMAQPGTWSEGPVTTVHLQKPKPGYFPAYIRQRDFSAVSGDELVKPDGRRPAPYRSYMDWKDKPIGQEEIRGWKRYPVLENRNPTRPAEGIEASRLVPLVPGQAGKPTFAARVRYHNLHPVELGALVWALIWGGQLGKRHSLGMGRPLGWGQVTVTATLDPDQTQALAAFVSAMEGWAQGKGLASGWVNSVQVRQLLAMADPVVGDRNQAKLRQMVLAPDANPSRNDFLEAKKAGSVLPEYDIDDVQDVRTGPDPAQVKGLAELEHKNQKDEARRAVAEGKAAFDQARQARKDAAQRELREAENRVLAGVAADNADLYAVGSRVLVDGEGEPRIVLAKDGNSWRFVSRRADGSGREKVRVTRLSAAP
ncbi:MAG: TIGR03986 family type III CRISPR-associated RAMP protein [Gemmobacter sp.]